MADDQLQRILDLVIGIKDDIAKISEKTTANSVVLEEHARRSTASEKRQDIQEEKLDKTIDYFDKRLDPIEQKVRFTTWVIAGALTLLSVTATVISIVQFFRH